MCSKYYSKRQLHVCGEKFCKKCFSNHTKQLFCPIKQRIKKIKNISNYICEITFEENYIYTISLSEINSDNNIIIYRFIKNQNHYSEIVICRKTNEEIKERKYAFKVDVSIENIIETLEILNTCPNFILSKGSFIKLLDLIDLSTFKIYCKNKNIYKISSKYYSISTIESYIDFDKVYILKQLDINVSPLYLIDIPKIEQLKMHEIIQQVTIEDFLSNYKNSDMNMFDYINNYKGEIQNLNHCKKIEFCNNFSKSTIIVFTHAFEKMDYFLKIIAKNMNNKLGKPLNTFDSVLNFNSFSSCIFSIFITALDKQKIPTLPSCIPGTIMNTSKYEISFCKILNEYHLIQFKDHEIQSYINNDGRQFQKSFYSADWYCKQCKIAIFIEGNFKYVCNKHEKSVKHIFKNKKRFLLAKRGKQKRLKFIAITKSEIDKTFVIGQCCIVNNQYNHDFKESILYYSDFGKNVLSELDNYDRSKYTRMNYQKCIHPAFTVHMKNQFKSDGISKAIKFDIDSAYLSVLTHEDFKLPKSNIPDKVLVNNDANIFFHQLNLLDDNFGMVKGFVIKRDKYTLPFIPFRSDESGIIYTKCLKCKHYNMCNHFDMNKGFYTEGYISDFLYMKKIGYDIDVTQLIYFKSIHNEELHYLAEQLITFRKNKCKFISKMAKQSALIGLGRFALNIGKNVFNDVEILENNQELCLGIEKNEIDNIDIISNYVLCQKKKKIKNFENAKISTSLNCSSLLFGSVSNYVRREMFNAYRHIENCDNANVIRIDTDSIMIEFNEPEKFDAFEIFKENSNFNYKVEMDNIKLIHNTSIKSYYYENQFKNFLKVTGLRLSVFDRNNLTSFSKF